MAYRALYVALYCKVKDVEDTFIKVGTSKVVDERISGLRHATKKAGYRGVFIGGHISEEDSQHKEDLVLEALESKTFPDGLKFNGYNECITTSKSNLKYISELLGIPVDDIEYKMELLQKDAVNEKEEKRLVNALRDECKNRESNGPKSKSKSVLLSGTGGYTVHYDNEELMSCDFGGIVIEDGVIYTIFKSKGLVEHQPNK